ncbi:iron ABC transporter permease [Endozoicomonas sp. Mp262]|uniref:FecCD family ABC transporter permease n=1 Tax=Endozoicomonas sp. Mp262 TaxID=2919499 RepID=UPI0021DB2AF8
MNDITSTCHKPDNKNIQLLQYRGGQALWLKLVGGRVSLLFPTRPLLVTLILFMALAAAVIVSLVMGTTWLSVSEVLQALSGQGSRGVILLVQEIRLPRILAGLLAGAALACSGCLMQTLSGNRLATPDVLGVNEGATAMILISLLGSTLGMMGPWWLAPLGSVIAVSLLLLLSGGMGARGYRIIMVGLALTHLIRAVTELGLSQIPPQHAGATYAWSVGSLTGRGYSVALPVAIGMAVILPMVLGMGRQLSLLRFDEAMAKPLGLAVKPVQYGVLIMAVALAGLAVGIAGPISFIAIAAPVLASRFSGPATVPVFNSALLGGLLVVLADTLGRTLTAPVEIPAGVISSILGGPFLLWLLLGAVDV